MFMTITICEIVTGIRITNRSIRLPGDWRGLSGFSLVAIVESLLKFCQRKIIFAGVALWRRGATPKYEGDECEKI